MGPLHGIKIVEIAGIGPGPFCAMMLADMGAEIIRVDRKAAAGTGSDKDPLNRGRKSIAVDLKKPEGVEAVLKLIDQADALIEGFRPGVMERLGLGPDVVHARNKKLVYGRMTGWGQFGPLAHAAGHDMNYIAISGALHAIGPKDGKPAVPLNLVGDFGGGGMLLAFGIACGIVEAQRSGEGQVIDAAMTDGAAILSSMMYGFHAAGIWSNNREDNMLDGGAPFYDTYETKDGKYVAIGSIEPQFYALLLEKTGLTDDPDFAAQHDRSKWPAMKAKLTEVLKTKTRDEWTEIMEATDVCFGPILNWDEAKEHPHNVARDTFVEISGWKQPAPAPRFSRTAPSVPAPAPLAGENTEEGLSAWGFSADDIQGLKDAGAI